ncbi:M20/M25/M40 family metallo-hydrolase [Desertimonas flava]|uniref:M20/M25/M40 family metallo-hydrolase n=1 Tax=Desertimonas flava TaxID=2064846 RepID=UPI0019695A45|nr:M20/M25/M40 family metallo-hydrolase [Desertimonas flava]
MTEAPVPAGAIDYEVISLLSDLVRIESVNPSLAPSGSGEAAIAGFVADWAHRHGLATEWFGPPQRPSLLVTSFRGEPPDGAVLVLCGHLDTVGLGDQPDPLVPRIDGDRLVGRGAYDMKAGLAAALLACRTAAQLAAADEITGAVIVAAVADEEFASDGVQVVSERLVELGAAGAIVLEPTELAIGVAHKGFVWTRIDIDGVAAHGSRPHLGVDAVMQMGPVLVALGDLDRQLAERGHPLLGPGNLHASLVSGGTEESTIPAHCSLVVERRTLPGETVADVEADVEAVLDACRAADPRLVVTASTTLAREPMETPIDAPVANVLADAVTLASGREPQLAGMSYWADSGFLSAAGIPSVVFGPAGDGAHADHEWVSIASTVTCAEALSATVRAFCR